MLHLVEVDLTYCLICRVLKVKWMMSQRYGGWMVWSLDLDDFNGRSCNMGKYPLLRVLNGVLKGHKYTTPTPTTQPT